MIEKHIVSPIFVTSTGEKYGAFNERTRWCSQGFR